MTGPFTALERGLDQREAGIRALQDFIASEPERQARIEAGFAMMAEARAELARILGDAA